MSNYYTSRQNTLANKAKETLTTRQYEDKISSFAKDYLLTSKDAPSSFRTEKIEFDLERKMRSSHLNSLTKEKMNDLFNQLFTKKKETKTKTTQCSPERKQQRNLKENKEMKQSHKEIYMMLMGDSKKRDDYCKYKSCLTEMSRLSVMRRGTERVLSKEKITNKPIVDVKRNDNAKTKEFFTTFFKSEISKRNRNLNNNGDMFYTERKNNNNTNLNNERKKGYDTVVSMMKSKMKLYGIVSPVKNKKSHY